MPVEPALNADFPRSIAASENRTVFAQHLGFGFVIFVRGFVSLNQRIFDKEISMHDERAGKESYALSDYELEGMLSEATTLNEQNKARIRSHKNELYEASIKFAQTKENGPPVAAAKATMQIFILKIAKVQGAKSDYREKPKASWLSWAKTVLKTAFQDLIRGSKPLPVSPVPPIDLADEQLTPAEEALLNEERIRIEDAIKTLESNEQILIHEVYFLQESLSQFAREKDWTYSKARAIQESALKKLKKFLGPDYPERI